MEIERLGPYQIVGTLGRGGMGVVYEAVHRESGEPAAVKLLSSSLAQEETFRSRFEAEIDTLRKLNHPNIVRLFGFGEQDGHLFYAMELVDGNSLEEELRRGRRFTWQEVLEIGLETCHALRHAHNRGIVHRDIKPGNLLQAKDGKVKLSDFGIARLFGNTGMTSAGSVLGTAEYMAPEQAEGRPVDARADLYSLGGVMYVLLSRRPLFHGKSLPEILHKQRVEQPPPIRSYAPDTPEEFERILAHLLVKDPNARIPNASILARRLEAVQQAAALGLQTLEAEVEWFSAQHTTPEPAPGPACEPTPRPASGPPGQSTHDANSETLMVKPSEIDLPIAPTPSVSPVSAAETTMAATNLLDAGPTIKGAVESLGGRFVSVAEEELDPIENDESRPALISWQTWALVFALVSVGATIWWLLQPPTADALYEKIAVHVPDGLSDSILASESAALEPLIDEFLSRYSEDSRAARLRAYRKDIELHHLQRKFNLRVSGLLGADNLQPIEQEYLEAINYLNVEPEWGASRLQALIDLYERKSDSSSLMSQCVELARRRLEKAHEEIGQYSREQQGFLRERLDAADRLRAEEPEAAKSIYRAIVELYSKKPWAAEFVRRAVEAMKQVESPKQNDPKEPGLAPKKDTEKSN